MPAILPEAAYGRMAEASAGKDTTTGHYGTRAILDQPFPVYPTGFPDIIAAFEERIGRRTLGNKPASELRSLPSWVNGIWPQVTLLYTIWGQCFSSMAAHEEVIPL